MGFRCRCRLAFARWSPDRKLPARREGRRWEALRTLWVSCLATSEWFGNSTIAVQFAGLFLISRLLNTMYKWVPTCRYLLSKYLLKYIVGT